MHEKVTSLFRVSTLYFETDRVQDFTAWRLMATTKDADVDKEAEESTGELYHRI